ncbi:MAG: EAL domain-containing protein, partial [Schwartzia sp.]|nr:EAL domain-containing protein [Schwartzia sp. (in: firmicutes)]
TVAEGVETEQQFAMLKKLGCALAQGYWFSRPLHHSEFEAEILEKMARDLPSDDTTPEKV